MPKSVKLDQCVTKRHQQYHGAGVMFYGMELRMAAKIIACQIGLADLKAS